MAVVSGFLAMRPPTVTHNALEVRAARGGGRFIGKSDALKAAEDDIMSRLLSERRRMEADGTFERVSVPCSLEATWCFPVPDGRRDGEPMSERPDLDNLEKTFIDCLARAGFISDDCLIADKHTSKAWSEPCGIYFRLEGLVTA